MVAAKQATVLSEKMPGMVHGGPSPPTPTFEGSIRFPTDVGAFSDGNWIPLFLKML
jgi:hypothetical protein